MKLTAKSMKKERKKENRLSHSIIIRNNKKEHTCIPQPWDNIKVAKKDVSTP